jgi:uncharacterized protein
MRARRRTAGPLLLSLGVIAGWPAAARADLSAREVMEKNYLATRLSGFTADVTIKLLSDKGQARVRQISIWSKLTANGIDSRVLMRFRAPADVKDTGFLQIENSRRDDDIWIYLPALSKTRRLVASNKKDSFFGTDFFYGDILLPTVDKYQHALLGRETVDGRPCYVIESVAASEETRRDSGYSKKVSWIDQESFVERKVDYYDLGSGLLKTQTTYDVRLVETDRQRWMPMRREMVNHRTNHRTVYAFDRFEPETRLSDALFTPRTLELER